jgi:hypothetical protein
MNSETEAVRHAHLTEAEDELQGLRERAELTVTALLPVLPLTGSWDSGYSINERVDPTVCALPEERAEGAYAVTELHVALGGRRAA